MAADLHEFRYASTWRTILACLVLFGTGAVVFAHSAATNHRGLTIDGIALSATEATYFYEVACAASLCFVVIAIGLALARLRGPQSILLTDQTIVLPPQGRARFPTVIAYSAVISAKVQTVAVPGGRTARRPRFLTLVHRDGKSVILAQKLPSAEAFDRLCGLIADRVRSAAPPACGSAPPRATDGRPRRALP